MSRVDTLSDLSILQQMKYVEFIVFIARIAHEVFIGTKNEGMNLLNKYDKILQPLLDTVGVQQIFKVVDEDAGDSESSEEDNDDSNSNSSNSQKSKKKKKGDDDGDNSEDLDVVPELKGTIDSTLQLTKRDSEADDKQKTPSPNRKDDSSAALPEYQKTKTPLKHLEKSNRVHIVGEVEYNSGKEYTLERE